MKILAFDTTNSTLSVAILFDGKIVAQKNILEANQHSAILIPSIEECLNKAEIWYSNLDLIAFTNGPGSFTGIRVGLSCAKALAISTDIPIIAVSSLATIAYSYLSEHKKILVVNDARLDEFYLQEFVIEEGRLKTILEPTIIGSERIREFFPDEKFILAGSAKNMIKDNLKKSDLENAIIFPKDDFIDAKNVAFLALDIFDKQGSRSENEALYIRKPKISQRKRKNKS
ncbi:MAG: tRNA threonylcarbamoyladenosine biosynthesis protein TsaB [Rickettsiales bacterium]|jgi:tRNA threonylcarbamoyladenosine biosynthesis protein TsaB